jgi:hypothetical protein
VITVTAVTAAGGRSKRHSVTLVVRAG